MGIRAANIYFCIFQFSTHPTGQFSYLGSYHTGVVVVPRQLLPGKLSTSAVFISGQLSTWTGVALVGQLLYQGSCCLGSCNTWTIVYMGIFHTGPVVVPEQLLLGQLLPGQLSTLAVVYLGSCYAWAVLYLDSCHTWTIVYLGSCCTGALFVPRQLLHWGSSRTWAIVAWADLYLDNCLLGQLLHLGSCCTWSVVAPRQLLHLNSFCTMAVVTRVAWNILIRGNLTSLANISQHRQLLTG